jgi:hypothetical protein
VSPEEVARLRLALSQLEAEVEIARRLALGRRRP